MKNSVSPYNLYKDYQDERSLMIPGVRRLRVQRSQTESRKRNCETEVGSSKFETRSGGTPSDQRFDSEASAQREGCELNRLGIIFRSVNQNSSNEECRGYYNLCEEFQYERASVPDVQRMHARERQSTSKGSGSSIPKGALISLYR